MSTHMACRWNTTHELPKSRRAWTDDADRTITRPTTTKALTSIARRTKSAVDRAFCAFCAPARGRLPEHREVEILVTAAGDEHHRPEAAQRRQRGVRVGGLAVVVPLHPTSVAYQRHAVGESLPPLQGGPHAVEVGACGESGRRRR